jgi:hypothetical protein
MSAPEEWIRPLPREGDYSAVSHVRGTLLAAGRDQLRAVGRFAEYERLLPSKARAELDGVLMGSWFPVALAHEHFAAIDGIGLSDADMMKITDQVSRTLNGPVIKTLSSTLRTTGVTPWDIVPFYDQVWRRLFVGGAVGVSKVGPKDGRVIVAGNPLVKYRYHRIGVARHLVAGVEVIVGKRAYVREQRLDVAAGRVDYLMQWV